MKKQLALAMLISCGMDSKPEMPTCQELRCESLACFEDQPLCGEATIVCGCGELACVVEPLPCS